ncbi:MAG: glycosyltransferase [Clostridium sp.]|nr:glycosyltransferase [Clostridium sp.]
MKTLSLILTTYNSARQLTRTLESIEQQDYPKIEVNIKDGGSTDDTLKIIKEYKSSSSNAVNWTSSRDGGIYDAMNQGYKLSTGEVIVFFNDLFLQKDAVSKMMKRLEANPECVGVHADLVYATDEKIVRYWKMGPQRSLYLGWMPGHPTLFLKRELYEKYGLYRTKYKIAADYEFMVRFLKDKENKLAYQPETIIRMFYGGTSNSSLGSYLLSLKEGHMALKENGVKGAVMIDILRTCRVLWQFMKRR